VSEFASDILAKRREERRAKALRLTRLGWTQQQIAARLGVSQPTVNGDIKNFEPELLNSGHKPEEIALRLGVPVQIVLAQQFDGAPDEERMKALGIKVQPYDVWQFPGCHDLMGDRHPGRIPGELLCHVLYFFTKPGDLVVDPMAGSGTTLDACLLMGRKARGYDIDARHERTDIEAHDLSTGWPDTVTKAALVFWDPPYFDKMDHASIGDDGYIEGSISGLDPDEYLAWFADRFAELHKQVKPGTRFAFLMSDWDPENAKRHQGHAGIFVWDYADRLRDAGWTLRRHIQVPLSTQQVHPDIVNKFRASRRLARLERYLLVAEA
jgi:transcriptional regulator with XRE-family HTH domain